jgi:hypothetical protein
MGWLMCGSLSRSQPKRLPESAAFMDVLAYHHAGSAVSYSGNPASLGRLRNFSAGIFLQHPFLVSGLTNSRVTAAFPLAGGGFGAGVDYQGAGSYHEMQLNVAYGRNFGRLAAAISFNCSRTNEKGFASGWTADAGAGFRLLLTEKLRGGFSFTHYKGSPGGEGPAFTCKAGLGMDISEQLYLGALLNKISDRPPDLYVLVHYRPGREWQMQLGFSPGILSFWFGFGWELGNFTISLVSSFHPMLGAGPGCIFQYAPSGEKKGVK